MAQYKVWACLNSRGFVPNAPMFGCACCNEGHDAGMVLNCNLLLHPPSVYDLYSERLVAARFSCVSP